MKPRVSTHGGMVHKHEGNNPDATAAAPDSLQAQLRVEAGG